MCNDKMQFSWGHIPHKTVSTKAFRIPNIKLNQLEMQGEVDKNRMILREWNISFSEIEKSIKINKWEHIWIEYCNKLHSNMNIWFCILWILNTYILLGVQGTLMKLIMHVAVSFGSFFKMNISKATTMIIYLINLEKL